MRWRLSLLGLTFAFVGCQGNAKAYRYIETINAERRALEDRLYALEYDLESLDMELGEALAENDELRQELGKDKKLPARRGYERPGAPPASKTPAAKPPAVRRDPPVEAELAPPQIEGGTLDDLSGTDDLPTAPPAKADRATDLAPNRASDSLGAPLLPPPDSSSKGSQREIAEPKIIATAATLATNDRRIVRIALDPARSGGADFDGRRGDDGVTVVIQPKNDAGQIVTDPASISVAVLDPNRTAEQARVARWDLDAKQVAKLAEDPSSNRGLKLHFAWPDQPPAASLLRLYVRYTTADGEHFDTEQEIHVELPDGARSGRPGWRAER